MPTDQSADIDGHDIVYRPCRAPIGGHYGTRLDVVYINGQWARDIYLDEHADVHAGIEHADWWVFKKRDAHRREGLYRQAERPRLSMNVNAVTSMLFDLVRNGVGTISVFGADLYASGPTDSYEDDYGSRWTLQQQAAGVMNHEPLKQIRIHRAVHRTGKVVGDDRYLAAVTMSDEEYQAVIARWAAAREEAPV
jgi:hypothetical protein